MHPVGVNRERHVDPVVDEQGRVIAGADRPQRRRQLEERAPG